MTGASTGEAFAYCEARLRELDRDLYFSALFAPAERRKGLFALYAFNGEISRVRDLVRDPLPGEVRLQWWRDALAGAARGDVLANPVAAALLDTMSRRALDPDQVLRLIDARSLELYGEPVLTMTDLERRTRETCSVLIQLAAQVLGSAHHAVADAAEHAGLAVGMTRLLRRFAHEASQGRTALPLDLLERHHASREEIFAGRATRGVLTALAAVSAEIERHLDLLAAALPETPTSALPALLPAALVRGYLRVMRSSDYDPFRTPVETPQWRKQLTLWRASRKRGRIAQG